MGTQGNSGNGEYLQWLRVAWDMSLEATTLTAQHLATGVAASQPLLRMQQVVIFSLHAGHSGNN